MAASLSRSGGSSRRFAGEDSLANSRCLTSSVVRLCMRMTVAAVFHLSISCFLFSSCSSAMAADNSKLGSIYVIGNPLLDMVATVPASFLQEFSLQRGEAVLASPEQMPLYNRLETDYRVTRLPGGSALNTARIAQALSGQVSGFYPIYHSFCLFSLLPPFHTSAPSFGRSISSSLCLSWLSTFVVAPCHSASAPLPSFLDSFITGICLP